MLDGCFGQTSLGPMGTLAIRLAGIRPEGPMGSNGPTSNDVSIICTRASIIIVAFWGSLDEFRSNYA